MGSCVICDTQYMQLPPTLHNCTICLPHQYPRRQRDLKILYDMSTWWLYEVCSSVGPSTFMRMKSITVSNRIFQDARKRVQSSIILQSTIRSYIVRKKVKEEFRNAFDNELKLNHSNVSLMQATKLLCFFYENRVASDAERLVRFWCNVAPLSFQCMLAQLFSGLWS